MNAREDKTGTDHIDRDPGRIKNYGGRVGNETDLQPVHGLRGLVNSTRLKNKCIKRIHGLYTILLNPHCRRDSGLGAWDH